LITSIGGELEIYAHLNKSDRYCAIVATTPPLHCVAGRLSGLLRQLDDYPVSYLEVLVGIEHTETIETLLDVLFLPSAIYPAMRELNGTVKDFIVLSRTMEPLNFSGLAIDATFKPYIDHYVDLWKRMRLDSLTILSDRSQAFDSKRPASELGCKKPTP